MQITINQRVAYSQSFNASGDFEATRAAEAFLRGRGFSFGPTQGGERRAIMFGDVQVAKWRNLRVEDIEANHGVITGPPRHGPITVTIYKTAPVEALMRVLF